ncbi:MAG: hypothetical protein QXU28_06550 [Nitrososphaerota archaeon]
MTVAEMLGHDLTVIKTGSKSENGENRIAYLRRRREEEKRWIAHRNVKLEETYRTYEKLCKKAGLKPVEMIELIFVTPCEPIVHTFFFM